MSRRPVTALALTACLAAGGAGAATAVAAPDVIVHRESLAGVTLHDDCVGEDVLVTAGDIQFVLLEHFNGNGSFETFHVGTPGVTGTGTVTGTTYRYAEASIGQYFQTTSGTTRNVAVAHVTLVGTGGAATSTTTLVVVWRIDADGFHLDTEQTHLTCTA